MHKAPHTHTYWEQACGLRWDLLGGQHGGTLSRPRSPPHLPQPPLSANQRRQLSLGHRIIKQPIERSPERRLPEPALVAHVGDALAGVCVACVADLEDGALVVGEHVVIVSVAADIRSGPDRADTLGSSGRPW